MNDDMRRLCEAAKGAPGKPLLFHDKAEIEAIVRAVLTEMNAIAMTQDDERGVEYYSGLSGATHSVAKHFLRKE